MPTRSRAWRSSVNDVRRTHGATLGRIDRDEPFYAMARGLSRSEAERIIVRGFFQGRSTGSS